MGNQGARYLRLREEAGINRFGALILIVVFGLAVLIAAQILPYYFYYNELVGLMEFQAKKASTFTDKQIRENVMQKINELEIPIEDPRDLKVRRFGKRMTIELEYTEVVTIDLGGEYVWDVREINFAPYVEEEF